MHIKQASDFWLVFTCSCSCKSGKSQSANVETGPHPSHMSSKATLCIDKCSFARHWTPD